MLDLIGYSTIPDDTKVALGRLDNFFVWLLSVPWWAAFGFALIATMWLMWVSWPRHAATAMVQQPQPNPDKWPPHDWESDSGGVKPKSLRSVFENEEIAIWELATPRSHAIRDKTFVNCLLHGPAVISLVRQVEMAGPTFLTEDIEHNFIEIPSGRFVVGIYAIERCKFKNCTFSHIGIAGTNDDIEMMRVQHNKGR